jgi:CARDB
MLRRTVAGVGVLVLLILLILGVRGCLNARQEQAIEDYSNDAVEILRASKLEGDSLFDLLQSQGGTDEVVNIQNSLNGYQVESNQLIDQANDLDVPGDVSDAQDYLLDILELRRDGLRTVARAMQVALGDQDRREGTQDVTAAMQIFLASDTLQQLRFEPALNEALEDEGLPIPRYPRDFVPDPEWLDGAFVADQVNALRTGQGGGDEAAAPGLHGNGIAGVSLGGSALTPGGSATVQLSEDLAFEIQVQNQGENTETDVNVRVTVGEGNDAIELEEPIDTIAAGEIQTVTIPLTEQPPTGQNVPITVEVEPVPGEEVTDNNTQEFSAIFTR